MTGFFDTQGDDYANPMLEVGDLMLEKENLTSNI
jgi:hypothetical protein